MMKLYTYSNELLTFVETKWVKARYVTVGVIISIVILVDVIDVNQSVGFALGSRSASILVSENNFLRQQVSQISPRVSKLEVQAALLNGRANNLDRLLHNGKIIGDTVSRFTNAAKEFKVHSLILAAKSYRR